MILNNTNKLKFYDNIESGTKTAKNCPNFCFSINRLFDKF